MYEPYGEGPVPLTGTGPPTGTDHSQDTVKSYDFLTSQQHDPIFCNNITQHKKSQNRGSTHYRSNRQYGSTDPPTLHQTLVVVPTIFPLRSYRARQSCPFFQFLQLSCKVWVI